MRTSARISDRVVYMAFLMLNIGQPAKYIADTLDISLMTVYKMKDHLDKGIPYVDRRCKLNESAIKSLRSTVKKRSAVEVAREFDVVHRTTWCAQKGLTWTRSP